MKNNKITVGLLLILTFIISSCNSSDKKEVSESVTVKSSKNIAVEKNSEIKLTPFTKEELEGVFPMTLNDLHRKEVSSYEWGKAWHAEALYMSSDNKPKSLKMVVNDLSYLNRDKAKIQLYGRVNQGLFHDIDEKVSNRFTRSKKVNGSPAVIEENSMEMFGEKYKHSKLETLLDNRLHIDMDGTRLTEMKLEELIGKLNLELLKQ